MVRHGERGRRLVGISKGHVGTIGSPAVKTVIISAAGTDGNRFTSCIIACTGGSRIAVFDCHRVFGGSLQFIGVGAGDGNRSDLLTGPLSRERVAGRHLAGRNGISILILRGHFARILRLGEDTRGAFHFQFTGRILFFHSIYRASRNLRQTYLCGAGIIALGNADNNGFMTECPVFRIQCLAARGILGKDISFQGKGEVGVLIQLAAYLLHNGQRRVFGGACAGGHNLRRIALQIPTPDVCGILFPLHGERQAVTDVLLVIGVGLSTGLI